MEIPKNGAQPFSRFEQRLISSKNFSTLRGKYQTAHGHGLLEGEGRGRAEVRAQRRADRDHAPAQRNVSRARFPGLLDANYARGDDSEPPRLI